MVNTKLLPPAHFPTKEALRLWLLKHIEHPSIRRALERGEMNYWELPSFSTIMVECISPLGGKYYLDVITVPNGLKIKSVEWLSWLKQLQKRFTPNRRSEYQGPDSSPDPDPDFPADS